MRLLVLAALVALGACGSTGIPLVSSAPAPVFPAGFAVVDVTRPLDKATPFVPHDGAFPFERLEFMGPRTTGWRTGGFTCLDHMGTHVSAPLARLPVGSTVDVVPAAQLIGPLVVVDLPDSAKNGGVVTAADVQADERVHGQIPAGAIVVLRTGRGALASTDPALLGKTPDGSCSFPGWGDDAVRLLAVERRVRAVGTDGPAIDCGAKATAAPAQSTGSVGGLWFVVGLADLSKLPARGATLFVGALPVVGAPGAPARVLALVPTKAR
jgi:kynurenine formamidase